MVQNGDLITLDVEKRLLQLEISDEELNRRKVTWVPPAARATRGYVRIYLDHVEQAELGADLDILTGKSGSVVDRDLH